MTCNICNKLTDIGDLTSPYVIRICTNCKREIKLREPGEKGKGIKVGPGERLVIPAGWLKISVNPLKGNSSLTKYGLDWFAKLVFVDDIPKNPDDIFNLINSNENYCEALLNKSEILKDLDLNNPEHLKEIFQRLNMNQSRSEWWAFLFATFNVLSKEAIENNDAKKAAWAMANAERCRSMCVYKETLEEVIWMGQSAKKIIDLINIWNVNQSNKDEEFWQNVFNDNPYVLTQLFSMPVIFIKDKAYVGGMNIDQKDAKFVDYLYTFDSSKDALLVEIKTPETKLLSSKYRNGVHNVSKDVSGSILQVLDYKHEISKNFKAITIGTNHTIEIFNPRCIVIVGNANRELNTELKRKSFELFRSNMKDVEIVTYDELFKKAANLATLFGLKWQEN